MKIVIIIGVQLLVIIATIGVADVLFRVTNHYILKSPYRSIWLVYTLDGKNCKVYDNPNPYDCVEKFQHEFECKDRSFIRVKRIKILK